VVQDAPVQKPIENTSYLNTKGIDSVDEPDAQPVPTARPTVTEPEAPVTVKPVSQAPAAAPQVAPQVENVSYTVKPMDTLFKIASKYQSSPQDIMKENKLKSFSDFKVGQTLVVPANTRPTTTAWGAVQGMLAGQGAVATPPAEVHPQTPRMTLATDENALSSIEPAAGKSSLNGTQVASVSSKLPIRAPQAIQAVSTADEEAAGVSFVEHTVAKGETIYRISQQYGVSVLDIMATNNFETPQDLKWGLKVRVPVKKEAKAPEKAAEKAVAAKLEKEEDTATAKVAAAQPDVSEKSIRLKAEQQRGQIDRDAARTDGMAWPVKGKVIQKFGDTAAGVSYTGINIAVPAGTPVVASEAGTVLYADNGLKAYGNMVLVRHSNGMVAAYAHNSYLLVKKGEKVKKGQVIAMSGATGNVSMPQLHFELRRHASAVDPLRVLPKL
jgi:murein DD-endopeptidase MepM/ murein hydrolase activator NlpD